MGIRMGRGEAVLGQHLNLHMLHHQQQSMQLQDTTLTFRHSYPSNQDWGTYIQDRGRLLRFRLPHPSLPSPKEKATLHQLQLTPEQEE